MPRKRKSTNLDYQLKRLRLIRERAQLSVYCKSHDIMPSQNPELLRAEHELALSEEEHRIAQAQQFALGNRQLAQRIREETAAEEKAAALALRAAQAEPLSLDDASD